MEEPQIYTTIDKNKVMEYIYKLLYIYNNTDYTNNIVNPYETTLIMKLEDGKKIIIPEKTRKECIISWHNRKKIESKKFKFNMEFFLNFCSLSFGILIIILFLYSLSLLRYITEKFNF
jgi:hypothetical protein